jgi:hypothetical protein
MTNSISLGQLGSHNPEGKQLCDDLYASYKWAGRCSKNGEDAAFIPDSLCRLRSPKERGSGIRVKRMKRALQAAVPQHEGVLQLLIQLLFRKVTLFPLCPFASSLSEENRATLAIQEIVSIHDQVANGVVTDCTNLSYVLCNNMRLVRTGLAMEDQGRFGAILHSYGVQNLDTSRKQQAYVSHRELNTDRRGHISDCDLQHAAVYFLMDTTWRWRKERFLKHLQAQRSNTTK